LIENFAFPTAGNFPAIYWFGIINAATLVLTLGITEFLRRRADRLGHHQSVHLLLLFTTVIVVGLILFGLATSFWVAVLAYGSVALMRGVSNPVFWGWINRGIPSEVRATVLSTVGQADAIGQVVGGPPIGIVANRLGLRAAMVSVGLLVSPALGLYARALGQDADSSE
jgi:DHA3 family tetracycline resistance protein-like MFS transporter